LPKELLEIKGFTSGTVSSVSTTDIPDDAASMSHNIDPTAEYGVLKGVPEDTVLAESKTEYDLGLEDVIDTDATDTLADQDDGSKLLSMANNTSHINITLSTPIEGQNGIYELILKVDSANYAVLEDTAFEFTFFDSNSNVIGTSYPFLKNQIPKNVQFSIRIPLDSDTPVSIATVRFKIFQTVTTAVGYWGVGIYFYSIDYYEYMEIPDTLRLFEHETENNRQIGILSGTAGEKTITTLKEEDGFYQEDKTTTIVTTDASKTIKDGKTNIFYSSKDSPPQLLKEKDGDLEVHNLELLAPSINSFSKSFDHTVVIGDYVYCMKRGNSKLYRYNHTLATPLIKETADLGIAVGTMCLYDEHNGSSGEKGLLLYDETASSINVLDLVLSDESGINDTAFEALSSFDRSFNLDFDNLHNDLRVEVGGLAYEPTGNTLWVLMTPIDYTNIEDYAPLILHSFGNTTTQKDGRYLFKGTVDVSTTQINDLTLTDATPVSFGTAFMSHLPGQYGDHFLYYYSYVNLLGTNWRGRYSYRNTNGSAVTTHSGSYDPIDDGYIGDLDINNKWAGFVRYNASDIMYIIPKRHSLSFHNGGTGLCVPVNFSKKINGELHNYVSLYDNLSILGETSGYDSFNAAYSLEVAKSGVYFVSPNHAGLLGMHGSFQMKGVSNGSLLAIADTDKILSKAITTGNADNFIFSLSDDKITKFTIPPVADLSGNPILFDDQSFNFTSFSNPMSSLLSIDTTEATFSCISTEGNMNIGTKTIPLSNTESVEDVLAENDTGVLIEDTGSNGLFESQELDYKLTYTYDNYLESSLTKSTWSNTIANSAKVTITIPKDISSRITHLNVYRSIKNSKYTLVKSIKISEEWSYDSSSDSQTTFFTDNNTSIADYEVINDMSETILRPFVQFEIATMVNNILAVTDCYVPEIEEYLPNYIFFSKPGQSAKFDYTVDYTLLPQKVNCIKGFAGRLYAFSDNTTYRIDPNSFAIEDIYDGAGCINNDSIVVTEFGMFFASKTNIYKHDGANLTPIGDAILKSSRFPDWSHSYHKGIKTTLNEGYTPRLLFDSKMQSVVVFLADVIWQEGTVGKAWAWNISRQRWDRWSSPYVKTAFQDISGSILISDGSQIYKYLENDKISKAFEWRSKLFTMGADTQKKKIYKLKVTGAVNGTVSNPVDTTNNNIFLVTDGVYQTIEKKDDNTYKLLTGRTAKTAEIWVKNQVRSIDSFGIVYRRKTVK